MKCLRRKTSALLYLQNFVEKWVQDISEELERIRDLPRILSA